MAMSPVWCQRAGRRPASRAQVPTWSSDRAGRSRPSPPEDRSSRPRPCSMARADQRWADHRTARSGHLDPARGDLGRDQVAGSRFRLALGLGHDRSSCRRPRQPSPRLRTGGDDITQRRQVGPGEVGWSSTGRSAWAAGTGGGAPFDGPQQLPVSADSRRRSSPKGNWARAIIRRRG